EPCAMGLGLATTLADAPAGRTRVAAGKPFPIWFAGVRSGAVGARSCASRAHGPARTGSRNAFCWHLFLRQFPCPRRALVGGATILCMGAALPMVRQPGAVSVVGITARAP